jgi:hypothetical protein
MRLRVEVMGVHQVYLRTGQEERGASKSACTLYTRLHVQQEEVINFVGILKAKSTLTFPRNFTSRNYAGFFLLFFFFLL